MKARILIIEDETELAELMQLYLEKEGLHCIHADTAEKGLEEIRRAEWDLILLDLNLPGLDGFDFLSEMRRGHDTPVIVVSARDSDADMLLALGGGADEYVTKPFSPKVLTARVRALLRRAAAPREEGLRAFGPFTLDAAHYVLKKEGKRISLSVKEFDVLAILAAETGRVISGDDLYCRAWEEDFADPGTVAVYIQRLRKKLGAPEGKAGYIETVRGRGYFLHGEDYEPE